MKILVWESYGEVEVYSLETEEQCKKVREKLIETLKSINEYEDTADLHYIQDIIYYVHDRNLTSWEGFDKLRLITLKE
jgi:hypothetical protein